MLHRRAITSFALLACLPGRPMAGEARLKVRLMAEMFPPLQYTDPSGAVQGAAYQLVTAALAEASGSVAVDVSPMEFVPLRRGLQLAAAEPNVLLLSVARTPEREARFRWLAPVSPYELWLYRRKDAPMAAVQEFSQLRGRGLRFGVQAGSNFHEWLLQQGVGLAPDNSVVDAVTRNGLNFDKAHAGRIDLFAHPEVSFAFRAAEHGMRAADFEKVLLIEALSKPLWVVTSLHSDARLVAALTRQLQRLRQTGQAERIRHEALKHFSATYHLDGK